MKNVRRFYLPLIISSIIISIITLKGDVIVQLLPYAKAQTVETAAVQPGSSTTRKIAIANVSTTKIDNGAFNFYNHADNTTSQKQGIFVFPRGVTILNTSDLPAGFGYWSGVFSAPQKTYTVAFSENTLAKAADDYAALPNPTATLLYGTGIFNRHANFISSFYCQNAGSAVTTITAKLYKAGDAAPKVTLTAANIAPGKTAVWHTESPAVQTRWPGGQGQFGYAEFNASHPIACVLQNKRTIDPYTESQYNAVPVSYAAIRLSVPAVFNGHGQSSQNQRALKWNTGIFMINTNTNAATVKVTYTAYTGYTNSCQTTIAPKASASWYAPEIGRAAGWTKPGTNQPCDILQWSYPGPTYGSAIVESTNGVGILAMANNNRYDAGANVGASTSSIAVSESVTTKNIVCPLVFNKNPQTDWVTGIGILNTSSTVQTGPITITLVKPNVPATGANQAVITKANLLPGKSVSTTLWSEQLPEAFKNTFEGAAYITAQNANARIAAAANHTNYNTLSAATLYDCMNYTP